MSTMVSHHRPQVPSVAWIVVAAIAVAALAVALILRPEGRITSQTEPAVAGRTFEVTGPADAALNRILADPQALGLLQHRPGLAPETLAHTEMFGAPPKVTGPMEERMLDDPWVIGLLRHRPGTTLEGLSRIFRER